MDFEATRADLIARRMKEPDPIKRDRLTLLIENINGLILDPSDDVLREQTLANVRDMAA